MTTLTTLPPDEQVAAGGDDRPHAPATHAPFFIVGSDRSGTTMLRLILDRAGDAALPPETMFISDFAPVRRRGGLDDHARAVAFTHTVWSHPRVRLWGLEGEPDLPPAGLSHDEAYRWGIEQPYLAYMRREGKTWWADKTPPYIDHVEEIRAVFPDARFVELVRDGRDVALSIMGLPFGGNNAWTTGRRWAHCIRQGVAARRAHPDHVMLVKYEELVADPAPHVRRLCEFLDLPYSDDMLRVEDVDTSKLEADKVAWFSNLANGINQTAVGKWRTKMTPGDQRVFLAAAGSELALHGYQPGPDAPTPVVVSPTRARWWEALNLAQRLVNVVRLRVFQERGRELRYVVQRRLPRR